MPEESGTGGGRPGTREEKAPPSRYPDPGPLHGLKVLVTRPAHQAAPLAGKLRAAGALPLLWPALDIEPIGCDALPARLARADLAVFISPNAVEICAARLGTQALPPRLTVAAVGEGTARALRERMGRAPDLVPEGRFDSEGLLALPALAGMSGKRVLIVRGEGGRELLSDTLRRRGATVEYAEVYRRLCPAKAPAEAYEALAAGGVGAITATSAEGLRNLLEMAGPLADRLRELPLVVVSERMAAAAAGLGFRFTKVARSPGDEALVESLIDLAAARLSGECG